MADPCHFRTTSVPKALIVAGLGVLILLALTFEIVRRLMVPPVDPELTTVIIADFDNLTGERVVTGGVEQAMTIALKESPFIDVYDRSRARELVERLSAGSTLTGAMARLVAPREEIDVVVTGEVDVGDRGYVVSVKALDAELDPNETDPIAETSETARQQDDLLHAVGDIASTMRGALGDSNPGGDGRETFTGSSLAAMTAYARARDLAYRGNGEEALGVYREAVTLDPLLGSAHADMGALLLAQGEREDAKASFQEAINSADRMTTREAHRVRGMYEMLITRNYDQAVDSFEALVAGYPADYGGHKNLALASLYVRDLDRACRGGGDLHGAVPERRWADPLRRLLHVCG